MLTAIGQRLEDISDDRMANILFRLFCGAVIASFMAWMFGVIEFRQPFLKWAASLFEWVDSFAQNFGTEMLGAFLTFILLEVVRGRREQQIQEEAEERRTKATQELVRSFVQAQEIARLRAARTPEQRQPILDSMKATGLLQGADLFQANLQGAILWRANLQGASLAGTNLQEALLNVANLQGAALIQVNLQGASLIRADLRGALVIANLQGANLERANLQGARFLTLEQLRQAERLEGTTLPDGTKLPDDDTWHEAFEIWCETVETETDPVGMHVIKPTDVPDVNQDDDD